ncbi:MAG TPA: YkvA family protein [Devosiaceae bacterium]|nr:YkvA family protein [Devosiaceae bacterium]
MFGFPRLSVLSVLRSWAKSLKRDVVALWIAARDPRVPWYAKWTAGAVAAYALSPIDLIPDFIPVLGYLDDVIIVPLGIALVIRMIPHELMVEFREQALARKSRPSGYAGLAVIVAIWICVAAGLALLFWRRISN